MANEFWQSVRAAAHLLNPQVTFSEPSHGGDAEAWTTRVRNAVVWLTPRSVKGYTESDFAFLPINERKKLAEAVSRFLSVARQVPPDGPATSEQIEAGRSAFDQILSILDFDHYRDWDAFRIGKQIEQRVRNEIPDAVTGIQFKTGNDYDGDPTLWILPILNDEQADSEEFAKILGGVTRSLEEAGHDIDQTFWPLVRFVAKSDFASAVG